MKRIVLEWCLLFSIGVTLAIVVLWVDTRFLETTSHHLRFPTTGNLQHDIHMFAHDGGFSISNQFEMDAAGKAVPLIVDARRMRPSDVLRGDRVHSLTIPGFDFHDCRSVVQGDSIWSLRISLLIPVALSFLVTLLIRILGKRDRAYRKRASEASGEPNASRAGAEERPREIVTVPRP